MNIEDGRKDTLHDYFNVGRYNSSHEALHYRIVYELMRDIVLLRDKVRELESREGGSNGNIG